MRSGTAGLPSCIAISLICRTTCKTWRRDLPPSSFKLLLHTFDNRPSQLAAPSLGNKVLTVSCQTYSQEITCVKCTYKKLPESNILTRSYLRQGHTEVWFRMSEDMHPDERKLYERRDAEATIFNRTHQRIINWLKSVNSWVSRMAFWNPILSKIQAFRVQKVTQTFSTTESNNHYIYIYVYIYIYAVKLLSGPSLGFLEVIIWSK